MTRRLALALFALALGACSNADPSGGTCERREECGNLEGLTLAECTAAEQERLDRLSGDARSTCESAVAACLDGVTCDDFRACQADIDRSVCPCPDPSLTIVSPTDGQTIGAADDADPSDAQLQYDFVIDSTCLEELEQVQLFLLDPVESSYGFGRPDLTGRATIRVPLIPGSNRFIARGMTTSVESAMVTVNVSP
ncbi:MAG: hypothetical protein H6719_35105 [Sandaracinaceae bacterium]|nr:hypothetical protein [Sandaracinaceae bacterium]